MPIHPSEIFGQHGRLSAPGQVPPSGWSLVFSDEFDEIAIDTSKWKTLFRDRHTNPPELEYYADDAFELGNSILRIRADTRQMGGMNYTSGIIMSEGKFDFTFGKVEARIKVPHGQGLWPAVWLVQNNAYQNSYEIDIIEILGHQTDVTYFTTHWPSYVPYSQTQQLNNYEMANTFHLVGIEWSSTRIDWFIDRILRASITDPTRISQIPMYPIINLAIGGDWPGVPDQTTPFPSYLEVDYIHIYQRA